MLRDTANEGLAGFEKAFWAARRGAARHAPYLTRHRTLRFAYAHAAASPAIRRAIHLMLMTGTGNALPSAR